MPETAPQLTPDLWHARWLRRGSGIVLLVYLTALLTGTHLPHPEALIPTETNDKALHFGAYFGLAVLMATQQQTRRRVTARASLVIWSLAALTGVFDELTQTLPGIRRRCEFADWLADVAGAASGLLVWHVLRRTLTRLHPHRSPTDPSRSHCLPMAPANNE